MYRLFDLKEGKTAVVSDLQVPDVMRRRLMDIGLVKGTTVRCVGTSPMGDPRAYLIRGAIIALRSEDSKNILLV